MNTFVAHEDFVSKISFSESGKLLTGGGWKDCTVKSWDIGNSLVKSSFWVNGSISSLQFIDPIWFLVGVRKMNEDNNSYSTETNTVVNTQGEEID